MAKLLQLLNEWEIQLLVVFSFTLQMFLFFTGGLRRRTTGKFIRLLWIAYLGADLVAVYALGFLSRHDDATTGKDTLMGTHQLAFFWAPFLLIHLGGQDTITAFAIEDNNLWLRHLLNLVVQVTLALYIFLKSTSGLSMQLIVPSILLFVTGTIKYGERTWALWCGRLGSLSTTVKDTSIMKSYEKRPIEMHVGYSDIIYRALYSITGVRDVFADSGFYHYGLDLRKEVTIHRDMFPKLLEIELGLMYDDIYTKATVIRTRCGIILRCISQISFVAAFVLFFVSNKQMYNSVDTAITYALFIGGFSLEVCAIFITMMSPWTWGWLKHRELYRFLRTINMGWQRKRQLWSYSMGQYNLLNYWGQNDQLQSDLWMRRVMVAIRKVVNLVCGIKQKLWISKLLDTKFIEADKDIMECVVQKVVQYGTAESSMGRRLPTVGPVWEMILLQLSQGFEGVIVRLHTYTELFLSRYSCTSDVSVRVCRKVSNYMLYLLATHPEMLPVRKSQALLLNHTSVTTENLGNNSGRDDVIQHGAAAILDKLGCSTRPFPDICTEAHLLEIQEAWIGLLIYAAGKSRPEVHAAQLARGGELLTFVWLLMAHHQLGDVADRIELALNDSPMLYKVA